LLSVFFEEFEKIAKTAIYTRLACANDERIEEQENELIKYAENNGYKQCVCYRDNGKSGATLNRPELQKMFSDIESGVIDTVIVQDIARLSRNFWEFEKLTNQLTEKNVLLIAVSDGGAMNNIVQTARQ
jgi:DNA invertase Pin-like site-specific DNA recombinase